MAAEGGTLDAPREPWWRRWLVEPVKNQLTCGMTVEKVSWTISLGLVIGVFPVMGTTSVACLLAGWVFRMNQALLHVFKTAVYPLHLALILVFIRLGERLWGTPLITFSVPELLTKFKADPVQFGRDFGLAALQGVSAWLLVAPLAAVLIHWAIFPAVRKLAETLKGEQA
jgi:uncharacterized protein (DUF2062 family)